LIQGSRFKVQGSRFKRILTGSTGFTGLGIRVFGIREYLVNVNEPAPACHAVALSEGGSSNLEVKSL
jgi:hypothetical protein